MPYSKHASRHGSVHQNCINHWAAEQVPPPEALLKQEEVLTVKHQAHLSIGAHIHKHQLALHPLAQRVEVLLVPGTHWPQAQGTLPDGCTQSVRDTKLSKAAGG